MKCPKCNYKILQENLNIYTDVAHCNNCGNVFKISENLGEEIENFNTNDLPAGTWYLNEFEKVIIGGTTRSPIAFFLVPFMLVWSGFSLGGLYGSQIISRQFDLFKSLFGIPFLIGSVVFGFVTLLTICGKVELTYDRDGGTVFTGVGRIGFKKKFLWKEISKIEAKASLNNQNLIGGYGSVIVMEGKSQISFGAGLNQERRYYILKSLQKAYFQTIKTGYFKKNNR